MKLLITKKYLVAALDKMHAVATKGVRNEFERAGRVTLKVTKDRTLFMTSNGHLHVRFEVTKTTDSNFDGEDGKITVAVGVFRAIAKALGGAKADNHVFEITSKENTLHIKDTAAKARKTAKMEAVADNKDDDLKFKIPSKGFSHTISSETFGKGILRLEKYRSPLIYKIRYQMICIHFLPDELRFVCGDGMRFGVMSFKDNGVKGLKDKKHGDKYILPVDQTCIIAGILDDAKHIELLFEDAQTCYIRLSNGTEMLLDGIPATKYIEYENHAYRTDKAVDVIDIKAEELREGVDLIMAVRDKTIEDEGFFHSAKFMSKADDLDLIVDEGKYQAHFSGPISFNDLASKPEFNSEYAAQFLSDVSHACPVRSYIRFHCIEETGTVIATPVDLDSKKDDKGLFLVKPDPAGDNITFFFASALT